MNKARSEAAMAKIIELQTGLEIRSNNLLSKNNFNTNLNMHCYVHISNPKINNLAQKHVISVRVMHVPWPMKDIDK